MSFLVAKLEQIVKLLMLFAQHGHSNDMSCLIAQMVAKLQQIVKLLILLAPHGHANSVICLIAEVDTLRDSSTLGHNSPCIQECYVQLEVASWKAWKQAFPEPRFQAVAVL